MARREARGTGRSASRVWTARPWMAASGSARSHRCRSWRGAPRSARNRTFRKPRLDSAAMDGREWIGSKPPLPVMAWRASKRAEQDVPQKKKKSADKPGSVVDNHSSGPHVAVWLKRPTRGRRGPRHGPPIRSCSRWGLPCRSVAGLAVRSYRTVSPLPDPAAPDVPCDTWRRWPSAVCSLLHFPSARAAQALPGTLPCGARTFLGARMNVAVVWPTPGPSVTIGG